MLDLLSTGILIKSNECIITAVWTVPLAKSFTSRQPSHIISIFLCLTHTCTYSTCTHTVHDQSLKTFLKTLVLSQRGFKELLFEFMMSGEKLWKFGNHNQETSNPLTHTHTHFYTQCDIACTTQLFFLRWDIISVHKQRFCLFLGTNWTCDLPQTRIS